MNVDLIKERQNSTANVDKLKGFFGKLLFHSTKRHQFMITLRGKMIQEIQPIDYKFYNLDRTQKYDFVFKKSLEVIEFLDNNQITNGLERSYLTGPIMGTEKQLFSLHQTMVRSSIELWANDEQRNYWLPKLDDYSILCTYAQTELGHGTYVRGLETTATYNKDTQTFTLNSPTITSFKYWPGSLGVSCNHAIVMAKLVINGVDHGLQGFMVQLRDLNTHQPLPNIEIGDIGSKFGFNSMDNGYLAFSNCIIKRDQMLMNFAEVTKDGEFRKLGNDLLMYASMLLMRTTLVMYGALLLSISLTISIRYSCVRRQTINDKNFEPQVLDYQTQQYRLFPALSTCYGIFFSALSFRNLLNALQKDAGSLANVSKDSLAQLHALSSALKAFSFDNCLKYAQVSRLCCGGHGYSASSGLSQIITEADAGCSYEGDNIILYLQTARYLLKCARSGASPHFFNLEKEANEHERFYGYLNEYYQLYDQAILEVGNHLMSLIKDRGRSQYEAWNESGVMLIQTAKIYINCFVIMAYLENVTTKDIDGNEKALMFDLYETYLLFGLCDTYASQFLKYDIIDANKLKTYETRLFGLFSNLRRNAIVLVDSFDWLDSNLCSSLGSYNGNAYEHLLEYARDSPWNKQREEYVEFEKYLKPFIQRYKEKSKI